MASGFKLTGLDGPNGLDAHLRRLAPRAVSETMDVLRDAGEDVRAAIKPALPRRTGAFQDSGKVSDRGDDSVAVTFTAHYRGQRKATIAASPSGPPRRQSRRGPPTSRPDSRFARNLPGPHAQGEPGLTGIRDAASEDRRRPGRVEVIAPTYPTMCHRGVGPPSKSKQPALRPSCGPSAYRAARDTAGSGRPTGSVSPTTSTQPRRTSAGGANGWPMASASYAAVRPTAGECACSVGRGRGPWCRPSATAGALAVSAPAAATRWRRAPCQSCPRHLAADRAKPPRVNR